MTMRSLRNLVSSNSASTHVLMLCALGLVLTCTRKAPTQVEASTEPAVRPMLPINFRRLGQPCDEATPDGKPTIPGSVTCSQEGRVTGIYQPADFLPAPPDTAVILSQPKKIGFTTISYVALDGDTIWIRRVTCGKCARVMGWSFIGSVPRLSPKQLLELQSALGLEAAVPALESAAEWQKQPMPSLEPPR